MGLGPVHCLASLLVLLLFCHGRGSEQRARGDVPRQLLAGVTRLESAHDMPELDVSTPLATVPVVNPTAVPTTPLASATPSLANPAVAGAAGAGGGGGGSWCVASPSASATALQVALDYACGQGGADCSAIQPGGSCASPDTVRDHASYAFNSYYQKNPVQTSCDFAGTAILTSTDPSTSTCKYPSTSTGASVLNTTTPTTPNFAPNFGSPPGPGYDNSPPGYGNSPPLYGSMSPPDYGGGINAAAAMPDSKRTVLTCLLVATVSLNYEHYRCIRKQRRRRSHGRQEQSGRLGAGRKGISNNVELIGCSYQPADREDRIDCFIILHFHFRRKKKQSLARTSMDSSTHSRRNTTLSYRSRRSPASSRCLRWRNAVDRARTRTVHRGDPLPGAIVTFFRIHSRFLPPAIGPVATD